MTDLQKLAWILIDNFGEMMKPCDQTYFALLSNILGDELMEIKMNGNQELIERHSDEAHTLYDEYPPVPEMPCESCPAHEDKAEQMPMPPSSGIVIIGGPGAPPPHPLLGMLQGMLPIPPQLPNMRSRIERLRDLQEDN
jgi:hypothetical protein